MLVLHTSGRYSARCDSLTALHRDELQGYTTLQCFQGNKVTTFVQVLTNLSVMLHCKYQLLRTTEDFSIYSSLKCIHSVQYREVKTAMSMTVLIKSTVPSALQSSPNQSSHHLQHSSHCHIYVTGHSNPQIYSY